METPQTVKARKPNFLTKYEPAFFILPAVIVLIVIMIFPMIYSIYLAFVQYVLYLPTKPFVGLQNFEYILGDAEFRTTIITTLKFSVLSVTITFVLGLTVALLLREIKWGKGLFRVIMIMPMAASPLVVALTWRWMMDPLFGLINQVLVLIGLPLQTWLAYETSAFISVLLIDVWEWYPLVFLIMYAGLSSLPREPYEAAAIEGASYWMTLRRITIPMLKPVILVCLLLRVIDTFRAFDIAKAVTGGGPALATETMSLHLYMRAFNYMQYSQAAAGALIMLFIISIFSAFLFRYLYSEIES
jgi:multiple sugar transport system permease protein